MKRTTAASLSVGLIAAIAILAFLVVGAVATPLHFDRCVPYPLGTHKDDKCTEPGGGPYKRIAIAEGSSAPFNGVQLSNHVISATLSGVKITITCKTASTSGSMENPKGGGAGTVSEEQIKLGECSVTPAELKCQIPGASITTNLLSGVTAAGPSIELKPEEGSTIAKFSFEKCTISALNKSHELNGTAKGTFVNGESAIEFTTTSGSSLTLDGASATFTGADELTSEEFDIFVE